jgi:hypothetical protein
MVQKPCILSQAQEQSRDSSCKSNFCQVVNPSRKDNI